LSRVAVEEPAEEKNGGRRAPTTDGGTNSERRGRREAPGFGFGRGPLRRDERIRDRSEAAMEEEGCDGELTDRA
jgi:hypothetical protein